MMKEKVDERTKELIAIGASISAHCQPCLTYHVAKAKELGLDADMISAAIDVGYKVQTGATVAMKEFANRVLKALTPGSPASCEGKTTSEKSCCE
ncbi:MAG: carboxymuconolactone decarboxylase family protein [Kiritimatiellae bacterium]|nr:carboxymuconolactone decarboxylase family protein [Kiritimatiellia bacterium]